jgi:hypothetical protein
MLISKNHRFIFLHIPKSAGQSVTNALMPFAALGYQKVLSPIIPYRWQLKVSTQLQQRIKMHIMPQPYNDHVRAKNIVAAMGLAEFQAYYSFTFVRNPWDRLLSTYTYTLKNKRQGQRHYLIKQFAGFNEFVEWHCQHDTHGYQVDWICDDTGRQLLSYVGKFENLSHDFQHVCEQLGLNAKLPFLNRSNSINYRDAYSRKSRDLVQAVYEKDIKAFDYHF